MLSSTLRSGTSVISWNAVWMPSACARGERSAAGLPCTHSRPALGSTSPDSSLTMVDLPAPFSPSSACTEPGRMSNDTSSTATVAP